MFRPSMLAIFRLYMRKLTNKLYQRVWGVYRLWGGVGWIRDLMDWGCLGVVLK